MRLYFFFILVVVASCHDRRQVRIRKSSGPSHTSSISYEGLKKRLDNHHSILRQRYHDAADDAGRTLLLDGAKSYFINVIEDSLYTFWNGTSWDFNGTTTKPKEGAIACGYFVTTLLRDAGVSLNRTKLAICPSLTMMKTLTSSKSIQNLSSLSYDEFIAKMKSFGKNLFLVGLDFHTGFLLNDGKDVWFIHSNYINKAGVTKEKALDSPALQSSKTRYITCLTSSRKFLEQWLLN